MADEVSRNARFDRLKTAIEQHYEKEKQKVDEELAFLKKVMKGRTGAERLNNASVAAATDLVVDRLATFLAG